MNVRTRIFLVLLQLVIGWHLFYEGWWKLHEPSWSSRGYLRNAQGPMALWLRYSARDPDLARKDGQFIVSNPTEELVARYTIKPLDPSESPEVRRWHRHLPPQLEKEWNDYFAAFVKHYSLDDSFAYEWIAVLVATPDVPLLAAVPWSPLILARLREASSPLQPRLRHILAERDLQVAKAETAKWIHEGTKKVRRPYISGGEVELTTPQRVQEYLVKVKEAQDLDTNQIRFFGSKVGDKYRKARGEESAFYRELTGDLNDRTSRMKRSIRDVLSYEQRRMPLPEEEKPAAAGEWKMLSWIDGSVKWGLLIAGAGLMLGLFTRLACVAGAGLLVLFYIAMPPLPGLAGNPMTEGHYFIVNLNIVEVVALLTIAVAHTGHWYGLDVWVDALKPWRWRSATRSERQVATRPPHAAALKEIPSGNGGAVIPKK